MYDLDFIIHVSVAIAAVIAALGSTLTFVRSLLNSHQIQQVRVDLNHRLTDFIEAARAQGRAEGNLVGRAELKKENK